MTALRDGSRGRPEIKRGETDMKKKLLALLLACVMIVGLAACSGGGTTESQNPGNDGTPTGESQPVEPSDDATEPPAGGGGTYVIGICQQMPHVALDAATQGFKDALTDAGLNVKFKTENAAGEPANCATIVDGFVAEGVDLILANATYPLQAAASATSTIPILGTSITDYATALSISDWTGTVGGNISGTSDLAPLDQQAAMIKELFPDAKNVGLLYCSGEPNSVYQITVVQEALEGMGMTCTRYSFTDANDLQAVTQTACDNADVIDIPTDNTAATYTDVIANVVLAAKVPVVAGEEGICSGCGVVTLSISYYDLGYATGKMAAEILANGSDISAMPVQFAPEVTKKYNAANCEALDITVPDDYVAIE